MNEPLLRAMFREFDGLIEAQLIDLDIAVSAESIDAVVKKIEYALQLEYQIACENESTPFCNLVHRVPASFASGWGEAKQTETREITLPEEVMFALAIALHTPNPKRRVFAAQRYAVAA
jgi:hypothetical protein